MDVRIQLLSSARLGIGAKNFFLWRGQIGMRRWI